MSTEKREIDLGPYGTWERIRDAKLDHRRTCQCGHRYSDHAVDRTVPERGVTGGWRCLAQVNDPDATALRSCSCPHWEPAR